MSGQTVTKFQSNLFFGFMTVSFIGNVCADYALFWYGISLINKAGSGQTLSYFYVGQALGVMLISPLLAHLFDSLRKSFGAILLDSLYAVVLLITMLIYTFSALSPMIVFVVAGLLAALSMLHKGAIGFAAVQKIADHHGETQAVVKFMNGLNIPTLVGASLSGLIYEKFGLVGCLIVGMVSFIQMPYIYLKIFGNEGPIAVEPIHLKMVFHKTWAGFKDLFNDRLLTAFSVPVAVLNVASSIMPGVLAIIFQMAYGDSTTLSSLAISGCVLGGILLSGMMGKLSERIDAKKVILYSILPQLVFLIVLYFLKLPIVVVAAFFAGCVGSTLRNIFTGKLRVARIPKQKVGSMNSAYSSLLYVGQAAGGLAILPALQGHLNLSLMVMGICFVLASIISYVWVGQIE